MASLVVAVAAAAVAVWQGVTSSRQLDLARSTETRTNDALTEIRELTRQNHELAKENKQLTSEIKKSIDSWQQQIHELRFEKERSSNQVEVEMQRRMFEELFKNFGDDSTAA